MTEPTGNNYLPTTSAMGEVPDGWTAAFIRERITEQFQAAGVNLSGLLCLIASDFAGVVRRVAPLTLADLIRFSSMK